MDPSQLTAKQISETLVGIIHRLRGRLHLSEEDVLEEAAKRVHRHEALVQDVLPDLRNRLADAQARMMHSLDPHQPPRPT
jgi:hypothetical protein